MCRSKSFTLIEIVVVMGIMGLISGGLLLSLRQIIAGETLLKKMRSVEEESRFIMDTFSQDAEYSDLEEPYKPSSSSQDIFAYLIKFILTERQSDINASNSSESQYASYKLDNNSKDYYLKRILATKGSPDQDTSITLNNTPLSVRPVFRVKLVETPDHSANYLITISLIFKVVTNTETIYIPVETSAMSRTFEF